MGAEAGILEGVKAVTKAAKPAVEATVSTTAKAAIETARGAAEATAKSAEAVVETTSKGIASQAEIGASAAQNAMAMSAESALNSAGSDAALSGISKMEIINDSAPPTSEYPNPVASSVEEGSSQSNMKAEPTGALETNNAQQVSQSENTTKADEQNNPLKAGLDKDYPEARSTADTTSEIADNAKRTQELEAKKSDGSITEDEQKELDSLNKEDKENKIKEGSAENSLTAEQQKIQQLEQQVDRLIQENEALREAFSELKEAMIKFAKDSSEKEEDPKKKATLLELIVQLLGIAIASATAEGVKTVAPPIGSQG